MRYSCFLFLTAIASAPCLANSYGVYAKPIANTPPSGYGFYEKIPYNEDTVKRITALHDSMCERADVCRADFYDIGGDKQGLALEGCPSPEIRNALGENAAASNRILKADMENLYKAFRTFIKTRQEFSYPEKDSNEVYPSYTSPLGSEYEFTTLEISDVPSVGIIGHPNSFIGNMNLDRTPYDVFLGRDVQYAFQSFFENEELPFDFNDTADEEYRQAFLFSTVNAVSYGDRYIPFADFCTDGKWMSWQILSSMRKAIDSLSFNGYSFDNNLFSMENTYVDVTTRKVKKSYSTESIKSFILSHITSAGEHQSDYFYPVPYETTQDKERFETYTSGNYCRVTRSRSREVGSVYGILNVKVNWTEGAWEKVDSKKLPHGTRETYRKHCQPTSVEIKDKDAVCDYIRQVIVDTKHQSVAKPDRSVYCASKNIGSYYGRGKVNAAQFRETRWTLGVDHEVTIETNIAVGVASTAAPEIADRLTEAMMNLADVGNSELDMRFMSPDEPIYITMTGFDVDSLMNDDYYVYKSRYIPDEGDPEAGEEKEYHYEKHTEGGGLSPEPDETDDKGEPINSDPETTKYDHDPSGEGGGDDTRTVDVNINYPGSGEFPEYESVKRTIERPSFFGTNKFRFLGM